MLQNVKYYNKENITDKDIYEINKWITLDKINEYLTQLIKKPNIKMVMYIANDIIKNGYIFNSVMISIIKYIINSPLENNIKSKIIFDIGTIEKLIIDGSNEYLQLIHIFSLILINIKK